MSSLVRYWTLIGLMIVVTVNSLTILLLLILALDVFVALLLIRDLSIYRLAKTRVVT
jgi:hypothetical protein